MNNRSFELYKKQSEIVIESYRKFICKPNYQNAVSFENSVSDFNIVAQRFRFSPIKMEFSSSSFLILAPEVIYIPFK